MVTVKSEEHIKSMRIAGKILAETLELVSRSAKPGMSTKELDDIAYDFIVRKNHAVPSFLHYDGFPATMCISIDDEIVHGIPSKHRILEEGMLLKLDCGVGWNGYHTDAAFTKVVGKANPAVKQMVKTTEEALWAGIDQVAPGVHIGDIGFAVERVLRRGNLGVIENYIGHGIGKEMHTAPEVPNYGKRGKGYILKPGDCICIEPMSSLGKPNNFVDKDSGWSVVLSDGSVGCHCEHTILVTEDGHEVLTLPNCPRA